MRRTLRVCNQPGCHILTAKAYCPTHTRRPPTRTELGYDNAWLRLSRAILDRDNHVCHYCGGLATTTDHIVPKRHGGLDNESNLVASCRQCNSRKGAR